MAKGLCSVISSSVLAACLLLTSAAAGRHEGPHRCAPIVVIGFDGMTYDVLEPLIESGDVPTLTQLVREGARAVLQSERPMRSPALWTTIATGQPRRVHQIYDFVTGSRYWPRGRRGGEQRLVTSSMRQAPALWQLAGEAGSRSLIVGWLNTWPAEKVRGVMVAPYVALGQRRQTSIKGKIYDDGVRQTHPPSEADRLRPLIVSAEEVDEARVNAIVDVPPSDSPLYGQVPRLKRYLYTVRWSVAGALTNTAIVEDALGRRHDFDLVMTYFDGADTLAHRFWVMREPLKFMRARLAAHGMDPDLAPELKARFGHAIDSYYRLADEMVARILRAAGPDATVLIISDHGWGSSGRVKALHETVPFDGEHRIDGVLIAHGPHIKPGRLAPLTLYDVAPTVLYLLGAGVPEALPGRVALEMLDDNYVAEHPLLLADQSSVREKQRQQTDAAPAPFSEAELERLRSLGYVQ